MRNTRKREDRSLITVRVRVRVMIFVLLLLSACASQNQESKTKGQEPPKSISQDARGRYLVLITGCNDCHTRGFSKSEATMLESDWLTGDSVGWQGPWGTTYAVNLRLFMQDFSEEAWVKVSRIVRTRPPMPWWILRELNESDSHAMYRFVRNLGPKGERAPAGLPPNQKPKTPYILFIPQPPNK
jgi:mono/diheme cytochrome c family protein